MLHSEPDGTVSGDGGILCQVHFVTQQVNGGILRQSRMTQITSNDGYVFGELRQKGLYVFASHQ